MERWAGCKNILCIRADNMGDLLMSSPAIRALKQSFSCKITVLTSSVASSIAGYIDEIDEVIIYDLPWVKTNSAIEAGNFSGVVEKIRECHFDAAVIFTVYSQNPLPAVMLAYLAGIPLRLAYCRENPYDLLTHWVPDKEPYSLVHHQVKRDLLLVASIGAETNNDRLSIRVLPDLLPGIKQKLTDQGVDRQKPWLVLHAGVSEKKREYPAKSWIEAGKRIIHELGYQVLLTGATNEKTLTDELASQISIGAFSMSGLFSLKEYILLIQHAPLVISVNSGPVHIAAATSTPVVVLYALTNPQHLPWKAAGKALLYHIPEKDRSKNEVIRFVHDHLFIPAIQMAFPDDIVKAAGDVLSDPGKFHMPEMIPLRDVSVD